MTHRLKHCPKCDRWLPRTAAFWHRAAGNPDGRQNTCRACRSGHRCPICGAQFQAYDPDQRLCGDPKCAVIDTAWREALLAEAAQDAQDRLPERCECCGEEFHHGVDPLGRLLDVCLRCGCTHLVPRRLGQRRRLPKPDFRAALVRGLPLFQAA